MNNDKISIIIPVYNVEQYLDECINSIINQSYNNLEIIFVDDGSKDNSGEILDKYAKKDKRIIVIHKKNEGVSKARNIGIDKATGKYICFCDGDDYLMDDYVEYLHSLIVKNDVDIALTTQMFTTFHTIQTKKITEKVLTPEQATCEILNYNVPIGVYCKIFKTEFLNKNKIRFNENIFIGEGFNFNTYSFQRANNVVFGNKKVYYYRRNNPTSATTLYSEKKWDNAIFAINNIKKDFIIKTKKINTSWNFAFWHTTCDAFNFMVMAKAEKENKKKYKKYKKIVRFKSYYSFLINIPFREKIRALLFFIYPRIVPFLINIRNRKHFK